MYVYSHGIGSVVFQFYNRILLLSGVAELDETFVLDCYKGSQVPDSAGREARKHGAKAAKRGISNEYVAICTGIQRDGGTIAATVNRAKPSSKELDEIFRGEKPYFFADLSRDTPHNVSRIKSVHTD